MPREIVTIQAGQAANWVGTHFWNIQDSYFKREAEYADRQPELDHDVLFRIGRNLYGDETYTPRLLVLDLKGSFGGLKKSSALYETQETSKAESSHLWGGKVERYDEDPYPKNAFLQHLDESTGADPEAPPVSFSEELQSKATVWSDFNKLYYHPKTMIELPHYLHDDDKNPFSIFTQGLDVMGEAEFSDEVLEDRLRFFVEEADSLQGFNIMADATTGFAGVTAAILDYVQDEFTKKSTITFGIHEPYASDASQKSRTIYDINSSLLLETAGRTSSLYFPLYSPTRADLNRQGWSQFLKTEFSTLYERSAYLAAAIETALLPVRTKRNAYHMTDLVATINGGSSRRLGSLASWIPFTVPREELFKTSLNPKKMPTMLWSLTRKQNVEKISGLIGQFSVLRGVPEVAKFQDCDVRQQPPSIGDVQQALQESLGMNGAASASLATHNALPIDEGFPQLFSHQITQHGVANESATRREGPTTAVACMTQLRMSHNLGEYIKTGMKVFKATSTAISVLYEKGDHGITRDDWRALSDALNDMADEYEEE
ncbi:Misato segment II tubulin-like domain-containing protein [Phlyctochytrium arcticum]|nr:Misato segment II tubulin-like domain-containing protein [Phlyctochytrium arcticum]